MKTLLKNYFTALFVILIHVSSYGQSDKLSPVIMSIAEELASDEPDDLAIENFVELLQELAENPVLINTGDELDIARLFFLSDFQVKAIADYVRTSGKIVSVYEIPAVPGFDRETAEMMIPFISLESQDYLSSKPGKWHNNLITNIIARPGETDTASPGSLVRSLTKYKFKAGRFEGGMTAEKDPGEKFLTGTPSLPDFLSAHLSYNNKGVIRKIIIGDFSARFGQGTNINTGIRSGFSVASPGFMSGTEEIRPYTSADENNFFRGAAAVLSLKKISLSIFYSMNRVDASVAGTPDSTGSYIENLYKAGLHNSEFLLLKKDVVTERGFGMNFKFDLNNLKIGLTISGNRFSLPFKAETDSPENLHNFEGNDNLVCSVYYNGLINRILLFGELSANNVYDYALVQGITLRPADRLSINFLYRNYSPGFIAFHGRGPGNGSSTNNEYGLLGNFTFEAAKHLFISAGCDISWYPWLRYRCSSPSTARKEEIRLKYLPSENLSFDIYYFLKHSMLDNQTDYGIAGISENTCRTIKAIIRYSPIENLTFSSRIDYKVFESPQSKGILLLQDMSYRFRKLPVTVWFRYSIFSTDDWNSRIYTYENDLLYSFSIPAFSGEGNRSYLMVKWDIGDFAEIRLKYGLTTSLINKTATENNDEIKFQARIWF